MSAMTWPEIMRRISNRYGVPRRRPPTWHEYAATLKRASERSGR